MRRAGRGRAEVHRRPADRVHGVRRQAAQGVLAGRHRVQGLGLLPHRQPRRRPGGAPGKADAKGSEQGRLGRPRTAGPAAPRLGVGSEESRPGSGSSSATARPAPPARPARRQLLQLRRQEEPSRLGGSSSSSGRPRSPEPGRGRTRPSIGVIGGSGFYEFLEAADEVSVDTPYGLPSDPLVIGEVAGRKVAFVPRHGRDHRFPPHRIPYRANLWALRSLGVRQVLAPERGRLAEPRARARRRWSSPTSSWTGPAAGRRPSTTRAARCTSRSPTRTARSAGRTPSRPPAPRAGTWPTSGTLVVIDGPRFSTRAESRWYAAQGWSLVGMTGHPEAVLARELALCYTAIALVTDTDAGVEEGEGVTQDEVLRDLRRQRRPAARAGHRRRSRTCRTSGTARARTCWTGSSCPSSCPDGLRRALRLVRVLPCADPGAKLRAASVEVAHARSGPAAARGPAGRTHAPRSRCPG